MKFKAWVDKSGRMLGMGWAFLPTAFANPVFQNAQNHWAFPILLAGQLYCYWYSFLRHVRLFEAQP